MNKVEYFTDLAKSIEKDERRMNDDTISRQAAICAIEEYADRLQMVNWEENPGVPYKAHALNWAINTLRDLPSAERRGRWIKKYRGNYLCSVCGAWYRTTDDYGNIIDGEMTANYCESCGAKMDEVETNETCTSRRSE